MKSKINAISVVVICLIAFWLIGCAHKKAMLMSATYHDPNVNYTNYKKFGFAPATKTLLEKHLFSIVEKKLTSLGYIYDEQNPDFLVVVFSNTQSIQYDVPSRQIFLPQYTPGTTTNTYGQVGGYSYNNTAYTSGKWENKSITVGGGRVTKPIGIIRIYFAPSKPVGAGNIWEGSAVADNSTSDIRDIAPHLIEEILNDYPLKTGKKDKKISTKKQYNWLTGEK